MLMQFLIYLFANSCHKKYREKMTKKEKIEYHDYAMSGLHALTIAISAYWSLFYSCGGDKTAFNNTQCQNYPRNIHILNVLFTSSFMLF